MIEQPQERTVNLHDGCLEGFAYSQWMASVDSSESIDWTEIMKETDLLEQAGLDEKQTVN